MARGFARFGDNVQTSKGMGVIIQGSSNTFIEGTPAARVGDVVLLPKGIGVIVQGSPTVFINGRNAARLLDTTSPSGVIVTAASKTFTN